MENCPADFFAEMKAKYNVCFIQIQTQQKARLVYFSIHMDRHAGGHVLRALVN